MAGIFITGTDTDVGKTYVACSLIRLLRESGIDAVGVKPIECGGHDDSNALLEANQRPDITAKQVNPVHLPHPLAPASMDAVLPISFSSLQAAVTEVEAKSEFTVIEGAGGWLVPVDETRTMADLAVVLNKPVLLVAANRLGVLNHTLLTVEAIAKSGLSCAGIFLNTIPDSDDLSSHTNGAVLRTQLPEIPVWEDDLQALADAIGKAAV